MSGSPAAQVAAFWRASLTRETVEAMTDGMRRTRLMFGDRPICRVLAPLFLDAVVADRITSDARDVAAAFRAVRRAVEPGGAFQSILGIPHEEEALLACDRQGMEPDQIARIDGFVDDAGAWKTIEYNAESPGGIAFGDTLTSIFLDTPVGEAASARWKFRRFDGLLRTLNILKSAHRRRLGLAPSVACAPTIAVVDWATAPTRREFEICAERFTAEGCPSFVTQPSDLVFDGESLKDSTGRRIDVVYKRVLVKDLVRHGGAAHPLARALATGKVAVASGFGVHRLYRKEGYALIHHPDVVATLSADVRRTVERCVPWSALWGGPHDGADAPALRARALRDRERLVLKPTDDYGGHGVVLGWLVTPSEWEAALDRARSGPHLLQTRVAIPSAEWPMVEDGMTVERRFHADVNPYIWGGVDAEGFGARLAPGELLNVTAGGGSAVPVFVVEDATDPARV